MIYERGVFVSLISVIGVEIVMSGERIYIYIYLEKKKADMIKKIIYLTSKLFSFNKLTHNNKIKI